MTTNTDTHPVQKPHGREPARLPTTVTMQAYEVYTHMYGSQEALVTGGCRGGFGMGELIAFLYAYPHPREEWRDRVQSVFDSMKGF